MFTEIREREMCWCIMMVCLFLVLPRRYRFFIHFLCLAKFRVVENIYWDPPNDHVRRERTKRQRRKFLIWNGIAKGKERSMVKNKVRPGFFDRKELIHPTKEIFSKKILALYAITVLMRFYRIPLLSLRNNWRWYISIINTEERFLSFLCNILLFLPLI